MLAPLGTSSNLTTAQASHTVTQDHWWQQTLQAEGGEVRVDGYHREKPWVRGTETQVISGVQSEEVHQGSRLANEELKKTWLFQTSSVLLQLLSPAHSLNTWFPPALPPWSSAPRHLHTPVIPHSFVSLSL